MKHAIAIAVAKVRKKIRFTTGRDELSGFELFSQTWLNSLLFIGALFGIGAVVCLISALVKSGGLSAFVHGWLTALGGY